MKHLFAGLLLLVGLAVAQTPALSVSDQSSGYTVTIDSTTLAEDGFVVVHAFDAAGDLVLTPELGKIYLKAGSYDGVAIELDPGLLAEYGYGAAAKNVLPMLHVDANGNGMYDFPGGPDVPVMVEGDMVVATLAFALEPTLRVFDQTRNGTGVVIDSATLSEDGFVVVHAFDAAGDLVLTPELGKIYLEAGTHRFVTIELDPALLEQYGYAGPKDVLPMLHVDANGNEMYDFPDGPDVPVMVEGDMVVAGLELAEPTMDAPAVTVMGEMMGEMMGEVRLEVGADGLSVTLPSVTLAQPGFVVLHASDADGNMVVLPVLGASGLLEAGSHDSVVVRFAADAAVQIGDTVFAMLHVDDGDGVYRFPASDPPVTAGGAIVMTGFALR